MQKNQVLRICTAAIVTSLLAGCQQKSAGPSATSEAATPEYVRAANATSEGSKFLTQPLITHIYTADPAAHVFDERIYIYPSHDIQTDIAPDDAGSHFAMRDYHVFSMDKIGSDVTDHGVALDVTNVRWATRQLWAPDAAQKNGKYFLYFPAKDKQDVFRIGVAVSDSPSGPFKAQGKPIRGSYSTDPAVFKDDDGKYYLYFGGIRGGQLQRWLTGAYQAEDVYPADDEPALSPKIARLSDNMLAFAEEPRDVLIQDEQGKPLTNGDNSRRFFEAAWVHKYKDKYYFSYSTGDTHLIVYAIGDSPYGPFTYRGTVLEPVLGWTSQHSIIELDGQWYLFYHDSQLSDGKTHLRNIKVTELKHNENGSIETIDPYVE